VLGDLAGVKVGVMILIQRYIFDQTSKTVDGRPDKGFIFRIDANCLSVTTALKIEHAIIAPAVLIIANQGTFRVGRKCGLASAAEPKEERNAAILSLVS